ncbi:putative U5 snRNP 100 kd protein [Testicularia cyperi]|uniref:RNA helicase n=1 Tax=Testicularia cyperi TaxID=1882483 RepID=A0A317Y016_9BASI|nr:putative U5 snRNP 100 kd protein [Testicularia cyperi]
MSRSQPLSITELLEKQKAEAAFKPRFLSKAERAKQAELAKAKEEQELKQKHDAERKKRGEFERLAQQQAASSSSSLPTTSGSRSREPRPYTDGDSLNYDAADRESRNGRSSRYTDRRRADHSSNGAGDIRRASEQDRRFNGIDQRETNGDANVALTTTEQAHIRERYLGIKPDTAKKPRRRPTDKRFTFDWGEEDDTAADSLALHYQLPSAAALSSAKTASGSTTDASLDRYSRYRSRFDDQHWSVKKLEEMKERDWRIFREDFGISAKGGNIPKPLRSWRESTIPRSILAAIEEVGYTEPSPIQRQAIPIGLTNRDLIGIAETGSGKTASFLIPMLSYISQLPKLDETTRSLGPFALILVPTRELAQQIETETNKFASRLGLTCVSIVGGRDVNDQAYSLRNGAEIVIATPGRLKDCLEQHVLVLSQCSYVVMDEADKMVDMGFEAQVSFILDSLPVTNRKPAEEFESDPHANGNGTHQYRVTMLYSATMPPSVERIARTYLRRPATITIGDAGQAVATVEQIVEFVNSDDKRKSRLISILSQSEHLVPIIVFVNQKKMADMLSRDLERAGFPVSTLHSGKTQEMREMALDALRTGDASILVATDLAGRGIDVPNVGLVVNYQMPNNIEAYIHRIGRTGRAGKQGTAITFLDQSDSDLFYDLRLEISKSKLSRLPNELARHPAAQHKPQKGSDGAKRKRDRDDEG